MMNIGLNVLILVLMEDTHWEMPEDEMKKRLLVLILVLMEDTHWAQNAKSYD